MARQYLRKVEPYDQNPNSDWITMTGSEFYRFINSPEGKERYFIKWDDLVIEASREQYNDWLCDEKHNRYLREHENGWNTISLYSDLSREGWCGEELLPDPTINVELSAISSLQQTALIAALRQLDHESFYLIYSLYMATGKKTENEFAAEVPKYYVHDCHPAIIDRDTFQRVQEEIARRSSLRKTSSKTKTEQGKYSSKYAFGELLVCSECGSPYRRVTYMPRGQKRYVWRCINRLEHGTRVCRCSATMEEPELQAAVAAAMNERFQQQTARQTLADCVAAALAGVGNADLSLPAAEARLKALQERQMELLQMAAGAGPDNLEYDEEISQVSAAIMDLLTRKTELEREGRTDPEYDSRVAIITDTLERADSANVSFDDIIVRQMVSSIKVLDRERLSIRFKDGTEVEQTIEYPQRRVSA